jgi:glycosyltransferase involved in cell wall biosynthesis
MSKNIGFALEHSLGHTTHSQNLQHVLSQDWADAITPHYVTLDFHDTSQSYQKWPVFKSNWSLRASYGAKKGIGPLVDKLDAAFYHTQVTTLFSRGIFQKVPTIVSLDATPLQIDALGADYNHAVGSSRVESIKKKLLQGVFNDCKALITWSEWAKDSLVNDYGMEGNKITVIPPGIDVANWNFEKKMPSEKVNLLFVGGDFERKGGKTLLEAVRSICKDNKNIELHIVTKDEIAVSSDEPIFIHHGVKPNSPELKARFQAADLFVFPTRADCLALAVLEAMAAGLPVITTAIAALPEVVHDGEHGRIVPVDDAKALEAALRELVSDTDLRTKLSLQAKARATQEFDARIVYGKILQQLVDL